MAPKRIGQHLTGGNEPADERERRERRDRLRDAFARWASGVTVVAVREAGRVHALTVSAFLPVSVDPPLVLASLGPNASARPYLSPGARYAVSILGADQKGIASRYADTFPVGPSPFPAEGPPVIAGALATLVCVVEELHTAGDHELVIGRVEDAWAGDEAADAVALAYFRRGYHSLG